MAIPAESKFDVVIVGSGLGGLYCARVLGLHGFKVCVLEKNRQIGGNLQTFARDKCIFDTGVHYLGGMDEGQNLYQCFKYAGILPHLKLKRMDEEAFDVVMFDGDEHEYPHGMGYDNFINNLAALFPDERENIANYFQEMQDICKLFPAYNLSSDKKEQVLNRYFEISATDFIASFTKNEKLRQVLGGTNLLYAGIADRSPAYMHALVVNSYIESSWRCVNGGSQIALAMVKKIKESGGVVHKYAEAKHFIFEGDDLVGVELASGQKVYGTHFISNLHPKATMQILGPGRLRKSYENRMNDLENTTSVFSIHIVLKPESFKYLNKNYYWHSTNDSWQSINYKPDTWPESYMLLTPAHTKSDEYADSITVMAYMHFDEVAQWQHTFNTVTHEDERTKAYHEFKIGKAEKLLDAVEKRFPGLRDKIQTYYTSTPLSYRDYINTPDGSAYGVLRDSTNPLKAYISPRTKINNLYLTGQNLNMHGVLGVTVGAIITCSQLIDGSQLIEDIRNA